MSVLPSYTDCFFCGQHGDGLKMKIQTNEGQVFSEFVLDSKFQGWDNLAHGGIVTGVLDEVMWWTIFVLTGKITVTRKMETEYLTPLLCGISYRVSTKLLQERHGNVYVSGLIEDSEGKTVTRGTGLFRIAKHTTPDELAAKLDFSRTSADLREKLLAALNAQEKAAEGKN